MAPPPYHPEILISGWDGRNAWGSPGGQGDDDLVLIDDGGISLDNDVAFFPREDSQPQHKQEQEHRAATGFPQNVEHHNFLHGRRPQWH